MGRPQKIENGLGARLASLHEGRERKDFAAEIGVAESTLGNYVRGDRTPDWKFLERLKATKNVNLNWLLTGQGPIYDAPDSATADTQFTEAPGNPAPLMPISSNFVTLPQYDVRASAGRGLIAIHEMPVSETAFERTFLRNLGGAPDYCFMMWASGDSMLPTIADNSLLIVDSSQTIPDHDRIYVFSVGNSVLVKRALWRFDGKLELVSDNKAINYPSEVFSADRVDDLVVVGRVIFSGRAP